MSAGKMEMTLDEIIKTSRKNDRKQPGKGAKKSPGGKAGNVQKKKLGGQAKGGARKTGGVTKATAANAGNIATQRLVQKLVNKALAQNQTATRGGVTRKIIKTERQTTRGVQQRSKIITKAPRAETVVVTRRVVQQPRSQVLVQQPPRRQVIVEQPRRQYAQPRRQVIREVVVEQPVRYTQPAQRFISRPKPRTQVVYVDRQSGGGGSGGGRRQNFQQRRNLGQQRTRNADPFYSPPNYLQRI